MKYHLNVKYHSLIYFGQFLCSGNNKYDYDIIDKEEEEEEHGDL